MQVHRNLPHVQQVCGGRPANAMQKHNKQLEMGFVHKRVLEKCHPALCELLKFNQDQGMNTRKLVSHFDAVRGFAGMYNNSLYMYILMYNGLPEEIVSLLLSRLAQLGLPDTFLDFLNSFLLPREGYVTVEKCGI